MEVDEMLRRLQDPLGAPFYPEVFRALLVVTWVLHIFFVTLALGSAAYTVFGSYTNDPLHRRLSRTTARLTPNATGLGIVTGIAPLLFVQTIYDPIWYASNTLTGFWSVIFVFVVMGGYGSAYLFYMKGSEQNRLRWVSVSSAALLSLAGWIMHVLASVQLQPDQWRTWYAPDGIVNTRGTTFHDFNVPRLVFLLPLQAALSFGVVVMLYAWYSARSETGAEHDYLAEVALLGRRLALLTSPLFAVAGLLWAITQGDEFGVAVPLAITFVLLSTLLTVGFATIKRPLHQARRGLGLWCGSLLIVAVTREVIRVVALDEFGYSVSDYPYVVNWGSVLLFTATSVAGVSVLAYLGLVLFQSGLNNGRISAGVDRLGKIATGLLGAWFGFFLLLGLYAITILN